jgi:hypothetical protein
MLFQQLQKILPFVLWLHDAAQRHLNAGYCPAKNELLGMLHV